jgi:hypothetical protein
MILIIATPLPAILGAPTAGRIGNPELPPGSLMGVHLN